MTSPPDVPALRARIWTAYRSVRPVLFEMLRIRTFLRGSVYELKTRCGKPSCQCLRGELHRRWVLSESVGGRKQLRVLPRDQEELWCRRAEDYRQFRQRRAELVKSVRRMLEDLDAIERAQRRALDEE
jgi:hypothetical protein